MTQIGFTGSPLDRQDALRQNVTAQQQALGNPGSRLLRMNGLQPVLDDVGRLEWGSLAEAADDAELLFLGTLDGKAHFASLAHPGKAALQAPASWQLLSLLAPEDIAIWGTAKSLVDWHARHGFCSVCGQASTVFRAGWGRKCPHCGSEHFPRVDPVVIMLAVRGDKALVGRQHRFPPGRYSALAGFVEPGESLEEAVRREIFEEAGIRCGAVRYVASQPWPFPSSLMVACIAEAENEDINLDDDELEHAFWVSREEVQAAYNPDCADPVFIIPPPQAIAYNLMYHWAFDENG